MSINYRDNVTRETKASGPGWVMLLTGVTVGILLAYPEAMRWVEFNLSSISWLP
jgi:hypothetical protein